MSALPWLQATDGKIGKSGGKRTRREIYLVKDEGDEGEHVQGTGLPAP